MSFNPHNYEQLYGSIRNNGRIVHENLVQPINYVQENLVQPINYINSYPQYIRTIDNPVVYPINDQIIQVNQTDNTNLHMIIDEQNDKIIKLRQENLDLIYKSKEQQNQFIKEIENLKELLKDYNTTKNTIKEQDLHIQNQNKELGVNAQTNAKYIEQINIKNDEIQKLIEEQKKNLVEIKLYQGKDSVIEKLNKQLGSQDEQIKRFQVFVSEHESKIKEKDSEISRIKQKWENKRKKLTQLRALSTKDQVKIREDFETKYQNIQDFNGRYCSDLKILKEQLEKSQKQNQTLVNTIDQLTLSQKTHENSLYIYQKEIQTLNLKIEQQKQEYKHLNQIGDNSTKKIFSEKEQDIKRLHELTVVQQQKIRELQLQLLSQKNDTKVIVQQIPMINTISRHLSVQLLQPTYQYQQFNPNTPTTFLL